MTLLENESDEILITTFDLSFDVSERFYKNVKKNIMHEDIKKRNAIKTSCYFESKYKYIIFETEELKNTLIENKKKYEQIILDGTKITMDDIFLTIRLYNLPEEILNVFGAVFQERTIYYNNGNHLYFQIVDPESVLYSPVTDKKKIREFIDSFYCIWRTSYYYCKKRVESRDKKDVTKGIEVLGKILGKLLNSICEDKAEKKLVIKFHRIISKLFQYDDKIKLKEEAIKILDNPEFKEIIKKYHW